MSESHEERRGATPEGALFRATVDKLLALAESLPQNPTGDDLNLIREMALSESSMFKGNPKLEHRMRNILTVTSLAGQVASPDEAVEWIKETVRGA